MKKFFRLSHHSKSYEVSLDMLETRGMDFPEAIDCIDTDQIRLLDNKRAGDYKVDYELYRLNGGGLRKKEYLNSVAVRDFGVPWDFAINYARTKMITEFRAQTDWRAFEDQRRLLALADSGHATAAYLIGKAAAKKGFVEAVEWLVKSHNFGHVGALYSLSAHLLSENNISGSLACLVISSDKGFELASLGLCHYQIIDLMLRSGSSQLTDDLAELVKASAYSSARLLKFFRLVIEGEEKEAGEVLKGIINRPLNKPKCKELCEEFYNREKLLCAFFTELQKSLWNSEGFLPIGERLNKLKEVSQKYPFNTFEDFKEIEDFFEKEFEKLWESQ